MAEEMTIEQQQVLALAAARVRLQQQNTAPPDAVAAPAAQPGPMARNPRTGLPDLRDFSKIGPGLDALASLGIRGGAPAAGQSLGALTGPFAPAAIPVFGAIGGAAGSTIDQLRQGGKFSYGDVLSSAGMGAIPGSPIASGGRALAGAAMKQGAQNFIAKAVQTGVDEKRLPTFGEAGGAFAGGAVGAPIQKAAGAFLNANGPIPTLNEFEAANQMRDNAFRELRKVANVKVPPHELDRGSDFISSVGGKAALQQQASKYNQLAWQELGRETIGLKGALPIAKKLSNGQWSVKGLMDDYRVANYEPYETIKDISQQAKDMGKTVFTAPGGHELAVQMDTPQGRDILLKAAADVDALKNARVKSQALYEQLKNNKPEAYAPWQAARQEVETLSDRIDAAAKSVGDDKLLARLAQARKNIAQSYALQNSVNPSSGLLDPAALGGQLLDGVPLTDNLKKIADFANNFHREAVESSRVPAPGVNNLTAKTTLGMASQNTPPGYVAAFLDTFGPKQARKIVLSNWAQDSFAKDRLQPTAQDFAAMMARYGTAAESRQQ